MEEHRKIASIMVVAIIILAIFAKIVKKKLLKTVYANTGVGIVSTMSTSFFGGLGIFIPALAFYFCDVSGRRLLMEESLFGAPFFVYLLIGLALLAVTFFKTMKGIDISSGILLTLVEGFDGIFGLLYIICGALFGSSQTTTTYGGTPCDMAPASWESDEVARNHGFRDADDAHNHGYNSYAVGDSRNYTNFGNQDTKLY